MGLVLSEEAVRVEAHVVRPVAQEDGGALCGEAHLMHSYCGQKRFRPQVKGTKFVRTRLLQRPEPIDLGSAGGRNPFCTTLKPWEAIWLLVFSGESSPRALLGGAGFRPSTVGPRKFDRNNHIHTAKKGPTTKKQGCPVQFPVWFLSS